MFASIVGAISNFMYSYLLIVMLVAVGLYYTLRTRLVQLRMFKETIRVILEKPVGADAVSSFQALMVSTASRVGTGNIIGISTAICLGGYGAVFWMWVIAIVGGASAFIESTLAQIYKKRGEHGSYGGPAYYIEAALGSRALAVIFSIALIATYGVGFNMLCAYNLQSTFIAYSFYNEATTPWVIGGILAVLVGYCLFGGGRRVIAATSTLVPIMGVIYISVAFVLTLINIDQLPAVVGKIFSQAFDFQAIFSGFAGSCVMFGIKRGLYSNEAGVGSAPNAAAAADVSHPVKQGLVQMLSVFIDTLLICTATAFMCMTSGVEPVKELAGAPYVQTALAVSMGGVAKVFITVSMVLFAFTTLLGNLYYVDNCFAYIMKAVPGPTFNMIYRAIACVVIFIGAGSSMGLMWDLADVLMGCMAIINLPVICILGGPALKAMDDYSKQREAGKNPVFVAKSIGITQKLDYWQD
ncbi:alanine/glycine:cation symporter family protein [Phascolarctobacterium sp.]|uniref:alanine/glycine:cation symporter family protein n=1 Tax=Phascolarctobacterium sp. TaxID=2049039 RepID=UPI002A82CCCF|nr:alanine/glycine:cation symporter family protein [Phascolarctobacterium sp.]MDY5045792.1 alanine/glycine:cation symporter family protein [Phascolarctobacterium sp.]